MLIGFFILLIVLGFGSLLYVGEQQEDHEITEAANDPVVDLSKSTHNGMECSSCHETPDTKSHEIDPLVCTSCHNEDSEVYDIDREDKPKLCSQCHNAIFNEYDDSIHGIYGTGGITDKDKPLCLDCHAVDPHFIIEADDTGSTINREHIAETCGECHEENLESYEEGFHEEFYSEYMRDEIPSCTDCHGVHNIQSPSHPNSTVHDDKLEELCAEECHEFETTDNMETFIHPDGFDILPFLGLIFLIGTIGFCFVHLLLIGKRKI